MLNQVMPQGSQTWNPNRKTRAPQAGVVGRTVLAMLALGLSLPALSASRADTLVPVPTVTAAPLGVHHFPFIASTLNLAAYGYVEEEFDFSGTATAYINAKPLPFSPDGRWNVVPNPGVIAPYSSRLLVRRPSDPKKFNGTVVVEWLNDTASFDNAWDWQYLSDDLMRAGYAYVGVTAQYLGALALQSWEGGQKGDRYASIKHPGDSFSYDIFSQAGMAIARADARGARPLGELTSQVKTVLATGFSQSAETLFTYINAVHRLARVYDGFLVHSIGYGEPLSISWANFGGTPLPAPDGVPATPFIPRTYPTHIRPDRDEPVLMVIGEYDEVFGLAGVSIHNEADSDSFHLWEVAGMSHFDEKILGLRDIRKTYPGSQDILSGCTDPPPDTGQPGMLAVRAALHALDSWAQSGVAPMSAPRLVVNSGNIFSASIHRDPATNIATGGIRLPPVAVPIGTLIGIHPSGDWANCIPQAGAYDPWNRDSDPWDGQTGLDPSPTPEPDLSLLYPSHANYVHRVTASAAKSVQEGFLRPRDAAALLQAASEAPVP